MLVGGYIIAFTAIHNILFRPEFPLNDVTPSEKGFDNLKQIGAFLYHAYVKGVASKVKVIPDNTLDVTLNVPPYPREKPLTYSILFFL